MAEVTVEVEDEVLEAAEGALADVGMATSAYLRMALVAAAQEGGVPFEARWDRSFWGGRSAAATAGEAPELPPLDEPATAGSDGDDLPDPFAAIGTAPEPVAEAPVEGTLLMPQVPELARAQEAGALFRAVREALGGDVGATAAIAGTDAPTWARLEAGAVDADGAPSWGKAAEVAGALRDALKEGESMPVGSDPNAAEARMRELLDAVGEQ